MQIYGLTVLIKRIYCFINGCATKGKWYNINRRDKRNGKTVREKCFAHSIVTEVLMCLQAFLIMSIWYTVLSRLDIYVCIITSKNKLQEIMYTIISTGL